MGWPLLNLDWIALGDISSHAESVDTWHKISICEKVMIDWPGFTLPKSSMDNCSFEGDLPYFHIMFDKLISWNLLQMLFHIIVTLFCPCSCKRAKNTNIKRLKLMSCMWWKREEDDVMTEELVFLMGSMAIIDEEDWFA
jgi:hypothetical protein